MYNLGTGDCFVLLFKHNEEIRFKMMIDGGAIFGTKKPMNMLVILFSLFWVYQKMWAMLWPKIAGQALAIVAVAAMVNVEVNNFPVY